MSARSVPWQRVFNYLADLADAKPSAADYAMRVRTLCDVLVGETGDAEGVRDFLLFQLSAQQHRRLISKQHRELVLKLMPKPPRQKRGRPKGALGNEAYNRRYELYQDWIYEKTLNPSLAKEQFAKERLDVTDRQYRDDDFVTCGWMLFYKT